ncbi:hypothetical protein ACPWSR_14090 [Alloiococcus sp. CFN-8]|uniref:hypothetical protein n=1 Tax=Alloiococcus sp. CFN-8 TaxID=3416081 RepID=UPI003CEEAAEC
MSIRLTDEFNKYLESKGIELDISPVKDKELVDRITLEEAAEKLEILAELHKRLMGYEGHIGNHLTSSIGELMENNKANLRRLKRDVSYLKDLKPANVFEETLKRYAQKIITRGERALALASSSDYTKKVYRSMNNNEICLGNADIDSFYRRDGVIYIKSLNKCTYNLIECDVIDFINRLKKQREQLPYDELIKKYIEASSLEGSSYDFIRGMVNYPYECVKVCTRYRRMKKPWTPEKYAYSLNTAMVKDGEEI